MSSIKSPHSIILQKRSSVSSSSKSQSSKRLRLSVVGSTNLPLLVSFPGGMPLNVDDAEVLASRQATGKTSKTKVKVKIDKLTFEGTDYGEQAAKKDCYNYAIGVIRSGDDGTLHVYPCGHAFSMRPKPPILTANRASARGTQLLTNAERKESLTQEFGSKKKQSQVRAAKSNLISAENIAGAADLETFMAVQSPSVSKVMIDDAAANVKRAKTPNRLSITV